MCERYSIYLVILEAREKKKNTKLYKVSVNSDANGERECMRVRVQLNIAK